MGAECSCRPAAGLQQCLLASAGRYFWDYLSPAQICTRRQRCRLSHRLLVPSQGQLLRLFFFPAVFPTSQTENLPGSPHREWHCQALPFAEFYYAGAVLSPKRPHSTKNVPSGLWLTLPLSSKHFLSTTPKLLHQQSRTSLFPPVPCSLSALLLRLWRAAPSPCSAHSTPATGAYSCQKDPIQGNKCFATPLQLVER